MELDLRVVSSAAGACSAKHPLELLKQLGATQLRLSLLQHVANGPPSLLCDRVVSLTSGQTDLALNTDSAADLLVEAFSDETPPRLLASGMLVNINERPQLRPLRLLLVPEGGFNCTSSPPTTTRAFHSATTLPGGQVLLLGGLTHHASDPGALSALHSAEVYDPRSGEFTNVDGKLSSARAFHRALLIDGPVGGPHDLLLVGGASPEADKPVARWGGANEMLPLVPDSRAVAAASTLIRYYPWADPPLIEELAASPQLQGRLFHDVATAQGGEVVLLGGLAGYSAGRPSTVDSMEVLPTAGATTHDGPYPLQRARVGAAAAAAGSTLLVFGGNLDSTGSNVDEEAAEQVNLGSTVDSKLLSAESGSKAAVQSTMFSTLTALPEGSLLLVGGLRLEAGRAQVLRDSNPVQRLSLVGGSLRVTPVAGSFTPVAWHRSTSLPDGSVLTIGGMAKPGACSPSTLVCTSTWRYVSSQDVIAAGEPLRHARMGHALSWLPGDSLLVTGGMTVTPAGAVETLATAELSGQHQLATDPFGRPPGKASNTTCGE